MDFLKYTSKLLKGELIDTVPDEYKEEMNEDTNLKPAYIPRELLTEEICIEALRPKYNPLKQPTAPKPAP